MLAFLIAFRNFTIAVLLAWMGFSIAPDSDESQDSSASSPGTSALNLFVG